MPVKDITGQSFGRLRALKFAGMKGRHAAWECSCECGGTITSLATNLKTGKTRSCGCLLQESRSLIGQSNRTHGGHSSPTYISYHAMLQRCYNPKQKSFSNYGGRGIAVCERWKESYECFLLDMGERPKKASLERRNVDGNYEPENCCWADVVQQNNNMRSTKRYSFNGRSMTIAQWARELSWPDTVLRKRVKAMGFESAVTSNYQPRSSGRQR